MADYDYSTNEMESDSSVSEKAEFIGNMAKKVAEETADKLAKAEKMGFQYSLNDSLHRQTHKQTKTSLNESEKKRKIHLEKKQREGYLSNSEAKELIVLKQSEKKAKAGAKAEAQRIKTLKAKGKLKGFNLKEYEFKGDTFFKLDKVSPKKKKRRKYSLPEHLSRQASLFADDIIRGDDDNWGGEAAVKTKQTVKGTYDFLSGTTKYAKDSIELKKYRNAIKEEKKLFKADTEYLHQDFLEKNALKGGKQKKAAEKAAKEAQKRKIRRDYAKKLAKKNAENGAKAVGTTVNTVNTVSVGASATGTGTTVAATATGTGATAATGYGIILIIAVVIIIIFILILLLGVLLMGISGTAASFGSAANAVSYHTDRADIEMTEDYITSLELELENTINSIETDNPGYDEYKYNLVDIGHNSFDLANYMNALYPDGYTFEDVQSELDLLFDEMYDLTLESKTETRTRTYTNENGDTVKEEYKVDVLYVTLTKKDLVNIANDNLNEDQKLQYSAFKDTGGLTQIFMSPLKMDWINSIGRNYGTSRNPSTNEIEDHKGIDVNAPAGTDVYSGVWKGTVLEVGYSDSFGNYISIKRDAGEVIKFAHLQSVNVSAGDAVNSKTVIGTVGNTGSECNGQYQVHIETLDSEGNYMNPVFAINGYFKGIETSYSSSYSSSPVTTKNRVDMGLPTEYASGDVEGLISFAEQFIGTPYLWDGSDPDEGFDCSGYVSYCVRESGYYPMQRTDAQSIYELYCIPVEPDEAQPGDLVFFKGTNSDSPNTITHVGIYCGNGVMLHAGSPVNYCNINTSYWTRHLYGYGHIGL